MLPWLVFIESNTSGTGRLFAQLAASRGLRPILLSDDPSRYKYVAEDELDSLQIDTRDEKALLDACRELQASHGLAGVTSSSEYFVATAASVAHHLGLRAPSAQAIRLCRDKQKQRERLQSAGVGVPAFRSANSAKAAVSAAESLGFPVVLKTVNGSGSVGVKLCRDASEVSMHASTLLRQRKNERGFPVPRRILVESVAVGPEYSVETFDREVIGITQKHLGELPYFVEVGHDYPAPLPAETAETIRRTAGAALAALNLEWGPAHIELRLTEDGPKIIEVNPRLAGGYIPELVRLASGINLISETLNLVVGGEPHLKRPTQRYASLRFLLPQEDGLLYEVEGVEEAANLPGVVEVKIYSPPGHTVQRRGDFRDRIGHVIACADSSLAARHAAEKASAAIRLHVRPD